MNRNGASDSVINKCLNVFVVDLFVTGGVLSRNSKFIV